MDEQKEILKIVKYISRINPIGAIALTVKHRVEPNLPALAAASYSEILYHPDFFKLTGKEKAGLMFHEVLHIALLHPDRAKKLNNKYLANIAMDLLINYIIENEYQSYMKLPQGGITFNLPEFRDALSIKPAKEWETLELYQWLVSRQNNIRKNLAKDIVDIIDEEIKDDKQTTNDNNKEKTKNDRSDKEENERGEKSKFKEDLEKIKIKNTVRNIKARAQDIIGQTILKKIEEAYDEIPKYDWRKVLERIVKDSITPKSRITYGRPCNRYLTGIEPYDGTIIPERSPSKIAIFTDTSGSMLFDETIKTTVNIIENIRKELRTEVKIYEGDTSIRRVTTVKANEKIKEKIREFKGGGFTNFRKIFETINKDKPNLIIGITDGLTADWGYSKHKTLWITNKNIKPPFGKVIITTDLSEL